MKARDVMTPNPAVCTPETSLTDVARMFVDHDCGAVPVVEHAGSRKPIGIVTDRDIACRAIAAGRNALELSARDCMSTSCVTVPLEASLDRCCSVMEENRVRRLLVVDSEGRCVGVVSQADIARRARDKKTAEVLKEISQPTVSASTVAS